MKRDGARTSLWQDGVAPFTPKAVHLEGMTFNVLIVGGGVTGITTALELQKRGKRCIVVEAHTLCFGTTGGTTAHLNTFFDTTYDMIISDFGEDAAHLVAKATNGALELYRNNVEEYDIDCGYGVKDGYVYAQNSQQVKQLDKMYDAACKAGVDVQYTDRIPVPIEFEKAVVFRDQAQIHPTRYVLALAREFEKLGGVILEHARVMDVTEKDKSFEVHTSKGIIPAGSVIWATHIPPGINLLHFRCAPYRSYAIAVTLKDPNAYPDALAYDMYDPYHYYRTQEVDGQKYLIIGGEDHKTAHEQNTDAPLLRLEAHARTFFDVDRVAFSWSSQYFEPADGLAYIGHLPGNPDAVLVATGYSGNGMTYSHIAARLLTDLVTTGYSEYASLFDPDRIKPIAGFMNFVKENADVVKEFIGKRIQTEKLPELGELAPGEGRVVKYEGEKLAIYKDENGNVHAVNPVCTHAKCTVGWNSAEKSWDCPCHGARYGINGEVITGPARKGLEVVPLNMLQEANKGS